MICRQKLLKIIDLDAARSFIGIHASAFGLAPNQEHDGDLYLLQRGVMPLTMEQHLLRNGIAQREDGYLITNYLPQPDLKKWCGYPQHRIAFAIDKHTATRLHADDGQSQHQPPSHPTFIPLTNEQRALLMEVFTREGFHDGIIPLANEFQSALSIAAQRLLGSWIGRYVYIYITEIAEQSTGNPRPYQIHVSGEQPATILEGLPRLADPSILEQSILIAYAQLAPYIARYLELTSALRRLLIELRTLHPRDHDEDDDNDQDAEDNA